MSAVDKWLREKVSDKYVENLYSKTVIPDNYFGRFDKGLFYKYYSENDIDVANSDPLVGLLSFELDNEDKAVKECVETYGDKVISLLPSSNQAHANYLFKKLIDASADMTYEIPSVSGLLPMFDTSFKNQFYKFCFMQTT